MGESFEVVTDDLTGHAGTLDDLAGQLNGALATARGVDLTPDTFGVVGQDSVSDVRSLATTGQDALRTQVAALETASTDMRATAVNYQQQDVDTGTKLSAIGGDLTQPTTATAPQATTDPQSLGTQVAALHPPNVATDALDPPRTPFDPTWGLQPTQRPPDDPWDSYNMLTDDQKGNIQAQLGTEMYNRGLNLPPGAEPFSATNQAAALHGLDGYGIVVHTDGAAALTGVTPDGAPLVVRDLISIDPSQPAGSMPDFRQAMDQLTPSTDLNTALPRELWVQVPDNTSNQQLQSFMDGYGSGQPRYSNVTVYFRDSAGNDLGMVKSGGMR